MNTTRDLLVELQAWYLAHCDGDWEHANGVSISTLDNPGWRVEIALNETDLGRRPFDRLEDHRTADDWVVCWKTRQASDARADHSTSLKGLRFSSTGPPKLKGGPEQARPPSQRGTLSEQLGAGRLAPDLATSTSINVSLEQPCFCDGASSVGR
jgi:hypothetical protein